MFFPSNPIYWCTSKCIYIHLYGDLGDIHRRGVSAPLFMDIYQPILYRLRSERLHESLKKNCGCLTIVLWSGHSWQVSVQRLNEGVGQILSRSVCFCGNTYFVCCCLDLIPVGESSRLPVSQIIFFFYC